MTDVLGHRRIFGSLVPAFNTVVQPEFSAMQPPGVTHQTARFAIDAQVLDHVEAAAASVLSCAPDAVLFGLATDSFPGGLALLEQGLQRVRALTDVPVFCATHAVHAALRTLGAEQLSLVTPFDEAANKHVEAAFEASGFRVSHREGLAESDLAAIGKLPAEAIRASFERAASHPCDAIVQVGTGLAVARFVADLEADLDRLIVASNPALWWQALRETGIDDRLPEHGRLLAS